MRTPRLRFASLVPLLAVLALAGAGCGGGSGDEASATTDVDELLTQTFTGSKEVNSGNLDLSLRLESQGGDSELGGPVSLRLTGPFQVQDDGQLPKFALDAAFEGAGQSIKAGATSTGDKGYVAFQGTDYVVGSQIFQQFKAGFEQAQKNASEGKDSQSFASLGMDPRKWLTDPKNEGEAKVGDTDTIRITGGIDVGRLLDDVNAALGKATSLGLPAGEVPEKLTDAQRRKVIEAVKDPRVEIYTGTEDKILRRMVLEMGIEDSGTTGDVAFDVAIEDLNEDQDIAEPADAKPFDELLSQFGGFGALGGASAGGGSSGSGSGADLEKYSDCVTEAGEDVEKTRKCAELLAG